MNIHRHLSAAFTATKRATEHNSEARFDRFRPMPESKTPPASNHLEASRRLIGEMDTQLERVRALMLRRPTLVAKPPRKTDKT